LWIYSWSKGTLDASERLITRYNGEAFFVQIVVTALLVYHFANVKMRKNLRGEMDEKDKLLNIFLVVIPFANDVVKTASDLMVRWNGLTEDKTPEWSKDCDAAILRLFGQESHEYRVFHRIVSDASLDMKFNVVLTQKLMGGKLVRSLDPTGKDADFKRIALEWIVQKYWTQA